MLVGPTGTGKTAIMNILTDTLTALGKITNKIFFKKKLIKNILKKKRKKIN